MTDRLFYFLLQEELSEAKRIYPNRTSLQTVVNGLESAESDCELPCKIHHCSSESAPTLVSTSPC